MPELRRDPIIGRWVIIATERAKRPNQFSYTHVEHENLIPGERCPFCEGNEDMTPPEIFAIRDDGSRPNAPGWDVRVIPSISPFLRVEGSVDRHGHGMYDIMNARGAHEIIIETPEHIKELDLSAEQFIKSMNVVMDRIEDLEKDPQIKYVLYFCNYGRAAGGGHIHHARLQLIGTPVNLKRVKEEAAGAKRYFDYKDRCIYCDIIKQEKADRKRVMAESKYFIAIAPFASRFPFETWIMPKEHSCDFYKMDRVKIPDLVDLWHEVFSKISSVVGDFPFNFILHTAPFRRDTAKRGDWQTIERDYHWHFELLPSLTNTAGFEWGTGFYINPTSPEMAVELISGRGEGT